MYWWELRDQTMYEFSLWCEQFKCEENAVNMLEFLIGRNYLKARKMAEQMSGSVHTPFLELIEHKEFLREGFIPYFERIQERKKKKA